MRLIKFFLKFFLKALPIESLSNGLMILNIQLAKLVYFRDWTLLAYGRPQFYKHFNNLIFWYRDSSRWAFTARGVYARENMFKDCSVLDLCCGDGSYSFLFFSDIAKSIDAVDNDIKALSYAKRYCSKPNINFIKIDIINQPLPTVKYDVVVFNAAICYFTVEEIRIIFRKIVAIGNYELILCGMFPINPGYPDHKTKFLNEEDFLTLIKPYFEKIAIRKIAEKVPTYYFKAEKPRLNIIN
jgi:SAM-dependent methyltransferase